jgi:hypothetical protein
MRGALTAYDYHEYRRSFREQAVLTFTLRILI